MRDSFHTIDEEEELGKIYDSKLMKRLLTYIKPYIPQVILVFILIIIGACVRLAGPYLTKIAIDDYITKANLSGLKWVALFYIGALLTEFFVTYLQNYTTRMIGQNIMYDIRNQLFLHLQKLHVGFFDRNPVGRLMTRVMGDVSVLNDLFTAGVIEIFGDVFSLVSIVVMMFALDWKLALVTFFVLPLIFAITLVFQINVRKAYREGRRQLARINSFLQEHIVGMSTVQMFAQEKRSFEKFDERNKGYLNANLRSIFFYSLFMPMVEITGAVATALIIWYGGGQVIQKALTIGVLVAFLQYAQRFFWPIRSLSEKYNVLQSAMAASERIFGLLDTSPLITDSEKNSHAVNGSEAWLNSNAPVAVSTARRATKPTEHHLDRLEGQIEFRDVWFAYNEEDYVLKGVSFSVEKGEKVAIVGATGAGKTSIINLLCRFYEVNKGRIFIDGIDIRDIELEKLRRSIGIVQQDVFLFSGTIESNIRLGHEDIGDEAVIRAARNVHASSFIERLPEHYQSEVKEGGATLSVGQKQLISFARALAYNPEILVLDEATSSVDTETELMIQDALKRLMSGRTSIVIAHRLSTIQNADKIIVMHKGQIREIGNHFELLKQRGIYYRLYQLQYKGQEGETSEMD